MDAAHLRQLFLLANAFKEGDLLLGGTRDDRARDDARRRLLATGISEIRSVAIVEDGVTEALARSRTRPHDDDLDRLTIARLKDLLLAPAAPDFVRRHLDRLASEVIAAVVKVM